MSTGKPFAGDHRAEIRGQHARDKGDARVSFCTTHHLRCSPPAACLERPFGSFYAEPERTIPYLDPR